MSDVIGGMPDYARIASEFNRLTEENLKLLAERHKLEAEALKLGSERVKPDAEAVKLRREGWFYPVLAVGGFVGGIIAGVTAILRLIAGQP